MESRDDTRTSEAFSSFRSRDLLCDRFRVVRFIARGGMGELYEAEDLTLGERVALKTIRFWIGGGQWPTPRINSPRLRSCVEI